MKKLRPQNLLQIHVFNGKEVLVILNQEFFITQENNSCGSNSKCFQHTRKNYMIETQVSKQVLVAQTQMFLTQKKFLLPLQFKCFQHTIIPSLCTTTPFVHNG